MILKKPYAFLIKNFRKIHILLTILTGFIIFETHQLVVFFRDYIANNYSVTVTDNLVSTTISPWLYISIIVTILILVAVYILLKTKKKPTKMYFFTILYYIILLYHCFYLKLHKTRPSLLYIFHKNQQQCSQPCP